MHEVRIDVKGTGIGGPMINKILDKAVRWIRRKIKRMSPETKAAKKALDEQDKKSKEERALHILSVYKDRIEIVYWNGRTQAQDVIKRIEDYPEWLEEREHRERIRKEQKK